MPILFLCLLCLIAVPSRASDLASLANQPYWQVLGHYEAAVPGARPGSSAIHDTGFFLAADGQYSAEHELQATLAAMQAPVGDAPDQHAKCRFPARRQWLASQLPALSPALAPIACPAYDGWRKAKSGASLLLANGYLSNPASFYGHIFLKFDDADNSNDLLHQSINFGAINMQGDSPLVYIVKGVAGGYDAEFQEVDFYRQKHTYGDDELRDLWEFKLKLSQDKLEQLLAHTWEIKNKKYTYYFFKKNCAFRLLELLDVTGSHYAEQANRPWLIPLATPVNIHQANPDAFSAVLFHPSRQTQFEFALNQLTGKALAAFYDIVAAAPAHAGWGALDSLPLAEQQALLDTLIEYGQYKKLGKTSNTPDWQHFYRQVLLKRLALPASETSVQGSIEKTYQYPDRPPSLIGLSVPLKRAAEQQITIRPAYYDLLDADVTHPLFSQLKMGEMVLQGKQQQWQLAQLNVIDVVAVDNSTPIQPHQMLGSWQIKGGWGKLAASQADSDRHAFISGGYGLAWRQQKQLMFRALPLAALQTDFQRVNPYFGMEGQLVLKATPRLSASLTWQYLHGTREQNTLQRREIDTRLVLSKQLDVRISKDIGNRTLSLAGNYYW